MSTVDVIVPCYNYARFLRSCVASILNQHDVDARVLIIDDASQDSTQEVGQSLAAEDSRVEFRRHQANRGHIATYNEGLDWISSDYAMLLSADDLLTPGSLGRAPRSMDTHPEVGMVYGRAVMTDDPDHQTPNIPREYKWRVLEGADVLEGFCEVGGNRIPTQSVVVRTTVQRELGGYRAELPYSGDMEMWLRFAMRGPVGVVDADQGFYRTHSSNMYHQFVGAVAGDLKQVRRTFEIVFDQYAGQIRNSEQLKASAMRAIANRACWRANEFFGRGEDAASACLLDIAVQTFPQIKQDRVWMRARCQRLAGHRLWSMLRSASSYLRTHPPMEPGPRRIGLFPQL